MPKKHNWVLVKVFEDLPSMEFYFWTQIQTSTDKSNINQCSLCGGNDHKTNYKTRACTSVDCNLESSCPFKNKILHCSRGTTYHLYSLNEHKNKEKGQADRHHGNLMLL